MSRDLSYLETLTDDEFKQAIVVLEKLESISGSKKKVELLAEHKDNEVLREFFYRSLGTEKYYIRLAARSQDRGGADYHQQGVWDPFLGRRR